MLAAQAPPPPPNPCDDPAQHLVCPNLRMPAPTGLVQVRRGRRSLLLMANELVNVGPGQLRFKGRRASEYEMVARQVIDRRRSRSKLVVDTGARLRFKDVPGYRGSFWKFHQAARFELWDQDPKGHRTRVLGPVRSSTTACVTSSRPAAARGRRCATAPAARTTRAGG